MPFFTIAVVRSIDKLRRHYSISGCHPAPILSVIQEKSPMNRPVKTILAATDLSRPAFAALRRAALITRDHDASLELLHVIPDSFASIAWNEVRCTPDDSSRRTSRACPRICERDRRRPNRDRLRRGARLQTALLGSVSLDLVTESTCDVLLARTTPIPS